MTGVLHGVLAAGYGEAPPEFIGQAWAGGFYAGDISYTADGVRTHRLVVAPVPDGLSASLLAYKTTDTATAGTTSEFDGWANSNNMNNASHPAAQFCRGLSINGYDDWYLPARAELEICYYNLKPESTAAAPNSTGHGINDYAVPARASNYTTTVPAQTASGISFRTTEAQAWLDDSNIYWSSTSASDTTAIEIPFGRTFISEFGEIRTSGAQLAQPKTSTVAAVVLLIRTRAIRRVAG